MLIRLLSSIFGFLLAQFVWHTWYERPSSEYFVGGTVPALRSPEVNQSSLYLRHTFYAPVRPDFGWIQVLGQSRITLYVNGDYVAEGKKDGFDVAALVDMAPYLRRGRNVIAIRAQQSPRVQSAFSFRGGNGPLVSVQGAYDVGDRPRMIDNTSTWRCSNAPALRSHWWFETDYDDRCWPGVQRVAGAIRATVGFPPQAIQETSHGLWIGPPSANHGRCVLRRVFQIAGTVESAWLRLTSNSDYRLAVNGVICDVQEETLATNKSHTPTRRIYNLTPLLKGGENVLAVAITGEAIEPRILADAEVVGAAFGRLRISTDGRWQATSDVLPGWPTGHGPGEAALAEVGHLFGAPWTLETKIQPLTLPYRWAIAYWGRRMGLSIAMMVLTGLACYLMQLVFGRISGEAAGTPPVSGLAVVIPLVGLLTAWLATFDPRVDPAGLFQPLTVYLAIGAVLAQWLLLALLALPGVTSSWRAVWPRETNRMLIGGVLLTIVTGGYLIRFSQIDAKPLQHDEASALRSTQGFFERGFPSRRIHADVPIKYVETSELVYFCNVVTTLIFDDDRYAVRFPSVCWGAMTILLLYVVGSRMSAAPVGLIAATTYALSPICIQMACFGRYFTQLQFFCLLTVFFFWMTIRGSGRIPRRYLVCTAVSFLAMYFTWQGSALMAAGLVAACIWARRTALATVLRDGSVWLALVIVSCVLALHMSLRSLHLLQFLTYGTGISDLSLKPMWKFPDFDITFCLWESAWNRDALFPLLGIIGGCLVAIRHPFRHSARYLLLVFLVTAFLQSLLLPVYTWRYSFHLMPFGILLFGVSLSALCRDLVPRLLRRSGHGSWHAYAQLGASSTALVTVLVASGMTVQLTQLPSVHIHTYSLPDLQFSDLAGATLFLRAHLHKDDTILASNPHVVDHFLGAAATDYWPQSRFYTQAVLDDHRQVPLHRIAGTVMISSRAELEELFARRNRIWYVLVPSRHGHQNTVDVSAFLRQNMRVAYEGYRVLVLVRDDEHRPAAQRLRSDRILVKAFADYLAY